jgi:hypothetical protein
MKQVSSFLLSLGLIVVLLSVGVLGGCAAVAQGPTITEANPSSAQAGKTLQVVIPGTDLTDASAVSFGEGVTVNSYTVISETLITANISITAAASTGARDVSVTTPGGTSTLTGGFTVTAAPPIISSVSPNNGTPWQSLAVTITGNYFSGATTVSFGTGITVESFTVDSATQITANIAIIWSASTGSRDVSIITPIGTGTKSGGFAVTDPPEIPRISVEEVKAKLDAGSNIVIVDSRHEMSYDSNHIAGAISIPLSDMSSLSSEEITQRYSDLHLYDEIITYCE